MAESDCLERAYQQLRRRAVSEFGEERARQLEDYLPRRRATGGGRGGSGKSTPTSSHCTRNDRLLRQSGSRHAPSGCYVSTEV